MRQARSSLQLSAQRHQTEIQLASTLAGITSRVLLHPIDSVKTRIQNIRGRTSMVNTPRIVANLLQKEGLRGLYRGIFGSLIGVVPYSMRARELLGGRHLFAGSVAGLCGSVVKVPMDVVKKRLQAGLYSNINVAVRSIAAEGRGFLGASRRFYTGWRSAVLYDVPYNAIQFTILENVKRAYRNVKRGGMTGVDNVFVGAVTGVFTSLLTEPLDVVKTRMMVQRMRTVAGTVGSGVYYSGWLDCVKRICKEEGVRALWKGTSARLVWVALSSAVWYGTYETARQAFGNRRVKELPLDPDPD